jgi:uncharacterized membrane protein YjgN (DUF898 family)
MTRCQRPRVTLLAAVPMFAVLFGLGVLNALAGTQISSPDDKSKAGTMMFYGVIGVLATTVLFQMLVWPYTTSRMQNLVWNGTRSQRLTFQRHLRLFDRLQPQMAKLPRLPIALASHPSDDERVRFFRDAAK